MQPNLHRLIPEVMSPNLPKLELTPFPALTMEETQVQFQMEVKPVEMPRLKVGVKLPEEMNLPIIPQMLETTAQVMQEELESLVLEATQVQIPRQAARTLEPERILLVAREKAMMLAATTPELDPMMTPARMTTLNKLKRSTLKI